MVDIVVTATSVVASSSATVVNGKAGATITAGQVVYREVATGLFKLADSNVSGETRTPVGIALNGASTNQSLAVCTSGDVTMTATTLVAGQPYYVSETPGGFQPVADAFTSTEQVIQLGFARSATVLAIQIINTGVVV